MIGHLKLGGSLILKPTYLSTPKARLCKKIKEILEIIF